MVFAGSSFPSYEFRGGVLQGQNLQETIVTSALDPKP